jgi:hypothetical protein
LALAYVAHPTVEIDERPNLIVTDCGGGDDIAAVGVAHEHDRTAQGAQELGEVSGVSSEIAKRVAEPDRGVPPVLMACAHDCDQVCMAVNLR